MKARVCDRCGAVIKEEKFDEELNDLDIYLMDEPVASFTDLCHACREEFSSLIAKFCGDEQSGINDDAKQPEEDAKTTPLAGTDNNAGVSDKPTPASAAKELPESVVAHYSIRKWAHSKPTGPLLD